MSTADESGAAGSAPDAPDVPVFPLGRADQTDRVTVRFPPEGLAALDQLVDEADYRDRSHAVRAGVAALLDAHGINGGERR